MFVNLSNHPSCRWDEAQLTAAYQYGGIVDIPFPLIPAEQDEVYIESLAEQYATMITERFVPANDVLHIMGEMCFSFALIRKLRKIGFTCVASTSERCVRELTNGYKETYFKFVRFRKYE